MAYSDFTLPKVQADFGLLFTETTEVFTNTEKITPSDRLSETLAEGIPLALAIASEKARSELIITPILLEVRRRAEQLVSLFSGVNFVVSPEKGLTGFCDFILSCSPEQYFITKPVVTIVEAKNDNINSGLGQCAAEMVAAQLFNDIAQEENFPVYGVVTTGTNWKFLKLLDSTLFIDLREYYINEIDSILAILLTTVKGR